MDKLDSWVASAEARMAVVARHEGALRSRQRRGLGRMNALRPARETPRAAALTGIAPHLPPL